MTLYEILGVAPTATTDDIKKAYRKKARASHPDTGAAGGDREQFHQVQHAYDVLSDPERRQRYDETGEQGGAPLVPTPTQILAEAFSIVLDAPVRMLSPLAMLKEVLQARLANERRDLAEHEREIRRWRKMLEKLERKEGEEAVLESVLERKIAPHTHGAEMSRGWIDGLQVALKMTDGYRYHGGAGSGDAMGDLLVGLSAHLAEEDEPRRPRQRRGMEREAR